jgi:cohesin loading factor subunit SCC2
MNEVGNLQLMFYCLFIFFSAPLEKLSALVEDIFEAEDSLAVDIDISELPKEFFSVLTIDYSHPHLQSSVIRKLTKYLSQLARPTKRSRRSVRDSADTPRARKALGDIDSGILARLLKIMERSIKAGEALDPLRAAVHVPRADKNASPRKPKKSSRAQKVVHQDRDATCSASLSVPDEDTREHEVELDSTDVREELTEADFHDLSKQLEIARDSILAVECCVALLSGEGLTKQVCLSG